MLYVLVDPRALRLIRRSDTDRPWSSPSLEAAIANGEAWGGLAIPLDVWRAVAPKIAAGELVLSRKATGYEALITVAAPR